MASFRDALRYAATEDERRRREEQVAKLTNKLMDDGIYNPDEINQIANRFLRKGEMVLPSQRTVPLSPVADIPERSTRQPINLRKRKALYSMDEATGKFTEEPISDDVSDITIKGYDSSPKAGENIYIKGGQVVKREPNGTRTNKTIKLDVPAPRTSGTTESPDLALAKDTVKKYQDALKKGDEITPEFVDSAKSAFEALNIPFTEKELPATFREKVQSKIAKKTGLVSEPEKRFSAPTPNFDKSKAAEYQSDLQSARKAIAMGKVTPEEAMRRLKSKYGAKINKI